MIDFITRLKRGQLPAIKEPTRVSLNVGEKTVEVSEETYFKLIGDEALKRAKAARVKSSFKGFVLRKRNKSIF